MIITAYTMDGNKVDVDYSSPELINCLKEIIAKVEKQRLGRVYDLKINVL